MAATMATMAILSVKCLNNTRKIPIPTKPLAKPISLLAASKPTENGNSNLSISLAGTPVAGAVFSNLVASEAALPAQQIADLSEGDNRGVALLLPILPAIAWVLFNILQPALNQINRMRSSKGVIVGLGIVGLAAAGGFMGPPGASAGEIAALAEAAASDNRGQLLLFVIAPAILWVLYNILQPALNQLNRMRSK